MAGPGASVEECLASGSPGDKYELALRLLNRSGENSDPSAPVLLLKAAAKSGHVKATVHLGSLYLSGNRVERSAKTAFGLYRKAAAAFAVRMLVRPIVWFFLLMLVVGVVLKMVCCLSNVQGWFICRMAGKGSPSALYKAALRYRSGHAASRQYLSSVDLFMQSAEGGFAPAQVELGHCYRDGMVVQQSRVKAAEWYLKAAAQGDSDGLYLAGQCYETGAGVPLFFPKAYGFYLLAAARGNRPAREQAEEIPNRMTGPQAEQGVQFAAEYAEEKAFDWFG